MVDLQCEHVHARGGEILFGTLSGKTDTFAMSYTKNPFANPDSEL